MLFLTSNWYSLGILMMFFLYGAMEPWRKRTPQIHRELKAERKKFLKT